MNILDEYFASYWHEMLYVFQFNLIFFSIRYFSESLRLQINVLLIEDKYRDVGVELVFPTLQCLLHISMQN